MLENPDASIIPIGRTDLGRPFRLGVLTGTGADPALTQVLAAGWADLRTALVPHVHLQMAWVGATGEAQKWVEHQGFQVIPQTTAPIGTAWNAGLAHFKESGVDAVLFMEPNSIADKGMVNRYAELLLDAYFSVALFDTYLIHPESGRAVFWTGHTGPDKGKPILTGRCISRPWLDQMKWAPWPAQAQTLEAPFTKRLDQVGARADAAGEYRTCGCLGWQFHPIVLRDGTPDGFFHQEGEAAEARQVEAATLLATHDSPEFAASLLSYRKGETQIAPIPESPIPSEDSATQPDSNTPPAEVEQTADSETNVSRWMTEGEAAFGEGRLVDAERAFRKALVVDPTRADILNNLAVARHAQGDAAGAERLLLKAIVFDLEAVDPFVSLTAIAQAEGRLGLALRYAIEGLQRGTPPELLSITRDLADKTGNTDLMTELDALVAARSAESNP